MNGNRFLRLLEKSGLAYEAISSPDETVIGLWPDFSLAYLNPGWFRFARENDGEPRISTQWQPGRNIFDCVPAPLGDFYQSAYTECLETGDPWGHEYECSSPDQFRLLHQQVYPLRQKEGLLLVHSTVTIRPIGEETHDYELENFINPDGFLVQCCHCRKFRNFRNGSPWIWLRELVRTLPENVSHGFCERCRDFHYPRHQARRCSMS